MFARAHDAVSILGPGIDKRLRVVGARPRFGDLWITHQAARNSERRCDQKERSRLCQSLYPYRYDIITRTYTTQSLMLPDSRIWIVAVVPMAMAYRSRRTLFSATMAASSLDWPDLSTTEPCISCPVHLLGFDRKLLLESASAAPAVGIALLDTTYPSSAKLRPKPLSHLPSRSTSV